MKTGAYDGVYIVGCGQTAYEKKTAKASPRLLWEASHLALQSAGLRWGDVDGLGVTCFTLAPESVTTIAEHFGLQCRFLVQGLIKRPPQLIQNLGKLCCRLAWNSHSARIHPIKMGVGANIAWHHQLTLRIPHICLWMASAQFIGWAKVGNFAVQ